MRSRTIAVACAAAWAVVHLLLVVRGWWHRPVHGEWDVLVSAVAIADGRLPGLSVGAIRATESGSALLAWVAAAPIALGLAPEHVSRLLALALGMALVGIAADWAGKRAGSPWGAAIAGVLLGLGWCHLHHETMGLWGTSVEALLPLLLGTRIAVEAEHPRRWLLAGALGGLAVLLSTASLPAVGLLGALAVVRAARTRDPRAPLLLVLGAAGAFALPFVFSPLRAPLLASVGEVWFHNLFVPVAEGRAGGLLELVAAAPTALAGNPLSLDWDVAISYGLSTLFSLSLLVLWFRGGRARPIALLALGWLPALLAIPAHQRGYPAAYRYWMLPTLLGAIALGIRLAPLASRRPRLAVAALALIAVGGTTALRPTLRAQPHRTEAFAQLGTHRFEPRPVRTGSERYGALKALLPSIPAPDRAAVLEGFGVREAVLLGTWSGKEPAAGWDPAWADALPPQEREAWLRGLGCGLGALPRIEPPAIALLAPLLDRQLLVEARALCAQPAPQDQLTWGCPNLPAVARRLAP